MDVGNDKDAGSMGFINHCRNTESRAEVGRELSQTELQAASSPKLERARKPRALQFSNVTNNRQDSYPNTEVAGCDQEAAPSPKLNIFQMPTATTLPLEEASFNEFVRKCLALGAEVSPFLSLQFPFLW